MKTVKKKGAWSFGGRIYGQQVPAPSRHSQKRSADDGMDKDSGGSLPTGAHPGRPRKIAETVSDEDGLTEPEIDEEVSGVGTAP